MLRQPARFIAFAVLQISLIPPYGALGKASHISGKHVAACHIEQLGVDTAVGDIAHRAHVPSGVEEIFDHDTEPTIKIDFPGGTLADLLNRLVSHAPGYQWREDDGIIHVLWHGAHLPLADVVMSYPGAHDKTVDEIWSDLAARPELNAWLGSNHCSRQQIFSETGPTPPPRDFRISISAGSMTLAQLLDRVALKSGESWEISQSPPGKPCVVSIFLPWMRHYGNP